MSTEERSEQNIGDDAGDGLLLLLMLFYLANIVVM